MFGNNRFRALDQQECLRLLAKAPVGRIVYTRQALPAVLPVNFALDTDGSVVLRTAPDSDLVRAVDGVVVAFEVDDFDAEAQTGWSVVVTGRASVVTDPAEHERLVRTGPRSWVADRNGIFLRVEPGLVTGREIAGVVDGGAEGD
ncbi:pyridoxamine 5'-phosphate oxidase family protein [Streptomyces flavalbus]|uniref:Pyridoxamine 5'-phosphate oxidase family protein n=1 Tax=Streptomyces flavalbus TaxID=2665155 RepID=A0ABW2WIC2_9ACTN